MRQTNTHITELKNKPTLEYYTLFELYVSESNVLRYVSNDNEIIFDGKTYIPYPISYSQVPENSNNEIETMQVTVSNVNRAVQQLLESNEMRSAKVKIIIVFKEKLTEPTAKIEDTFYIDSYELNEQTVILTLSTKFDVLGVQLPGRVFTRTYCRWQFKSNYCKYAGTETECSKKLDRCIELSNTLNFGGFPGIPPKKVYSV